MSTFSDHTILIVEDDPMITKTLSEKFAETGYNILVEHNGENGLKTALDKHPDLILLDLSMPGLGGIDVLMQLREDEWGKNAKIVLFTNSNDPNDVSDALTYGVTQYFSKADMRLEDVVQAASDELSVRSATAEE